MPPTVPFVADEEDQDDPANDLYSGPARGKDDDANDDDANTGAQPHGASGKFGPSGSGKDDGSSAMPGPSTAVSADADEQALVAPKYTAPDRTALNAAQSKLTSDSAAINRAEYKPKWYDRLLGGVAGGLSGDVEGGQQVTNRRLIGAQKQQAANVAADTTALQAEQGKIAGQDQDFEHQLQGLHGQVAAANANSLTGERAAKAEKYDAAIDPQSIHQGDDGQWIGTTYGGKQVPTAQPKWAAPKPPPTPKTYEELVEASKDPQYKPEQQKAFSDAAKQIESKEVKKFSATAPRPSEGEVQYGDWKKAFQQQNGRPPNSDEINAYRRGGQGGEGGVNKTDYKNPEEARKAKDTAFTTQQNNYDMARRRILASDSSAADKQKQIADLDQQNNQAKQTIQSDFESSLRQFNPSRGQVGSPARQAPPAGGRQQPIIAPKSGHRLAIGQQVNVPGKGMRYVTGYVNGKVQVDTKPPARG
jgi:hypothetical protein